MLFATDGFSATHSLVVQVARLSFQQRQSTSIIICSHFHRSRRSYNSGCRFLLAVELEQKKAANPRGSLLFFQTTGGNARSLQSIKDGILYDETPSNYNNTRSWSPLVALFIATENQQGPRQRGLIRHSALTIKCNSNYATRSTRISALAACFPMLTGNSPVRGVIIQA